jgi:hypothetical protein
MDGVGRKHAPVSAIKKGGTLCCGAPDLWDSAAFFDSFLASSFFCSQTESTPAHLRVTQTVGRFSAK